MIRKTDLGLYLNTTYMNWRTKMMYLTIWLLLFDAYDAVIVIQRKQKSIELAQGLEQMLLNKQFEGGKRLKQPKHIRCSGTSSTIIIMALG